MRTAPFSPFLRLPSSSRLCQSMSLMIRVWRYSAPRYGPVYAGSAAAAAWLSAAVTGPDAATTGDALDVVFGSLGAGSPDSFSLHAARAPPVSELRRNRAMIGRRRIEESSLCQKPRDSASFLQEDRDTLERPNAMAVPRPKATVEAGNS